MPSADSYGAQVVDALGTFLREQGVAAYDGGRAQTHPYTGREAVLILAGPVMPADPDSVIVLTPTEPVMLRADVAQTVQVRIRGAADARPWDIAALGQRIADLFQPGGHARSSFTMGGLAFGRCDASYPQSIGNDTNRRPEVTLNLRFHARRVARP